MISLEFVIQKARIQLYISQSNMYVYWFKEMWVLDGESRLDHTEGTWVLQGAHNHVASTHAAAHSVHRNDVLTPEIHAQISNFSPSGINRIKTYNSPEFNSGNTSHCKGY